eukprot:7155012-Alexandrium_andersonii.AAC.1
MAKEAGECSAEEKFERSHKEKAEKVVQDTLDRLDNNQLAEKDEFEASQKELGGVENPINMKDHQAAEGGGGVPQGLSSELRDKFEGGHEERIEKVVQGTPDRLDKNHLAEKD